ncbi:MAG TPA: hypothetical protein VK471_02755 [Solirubrobacterales bacterium]|nr:hypothetical protein [Solirubrobacterales bacterium]
MQRIQKQLGKRLGIGLAGLALLLPLFLTGGLLSSSAVASSNGWKACGIQNVTAGNGAFAVKAIGTSCRQARKLARAIGKSSKSLYDCLFDCEILGYRCGTPGVSVDPSRGLICVLGDKRVRLKGQPRKSSRSAKLSTAASQSECSIIENEAQLERANQAVENGSVQELAWWGQEHFQLRHAGRSGSLITLRLHHPRQGRSHLAFDYNCPAVLEISRAKRVYACEPDSTTMRIVCKKRWYLAKSSERIIRVNRPFKVHVPTDPDKAVSVSVGIKTLFIPEHYALEGNLGTTNVLRFTG